MNSSQNLLLDKWGRQMNYLRIAVTDRCNLRCFYCMPEQGIQYLPKKNLMTYEEILRSVALFRDLGVNKVRITGGEPFLRKGLIDFLRELKKIKGIDKVHITTNGVLTEQYLPELQQMGIDGINLSLDSVDKDNFFRITRRDEFDNVMKCMNAIIDSSIPLKINAVIMKGKNTDDIIPMAELTRFHPIHVRFIEEMPFNGSEETHQKIWNHHEIHQTLMGHFNTIDSAPTPTSDPASLYQIKGYKGLIGIIPAYSRTFCGSCNRIRMTALGTIKNCLYDEGVLDVKEMMRAGAGDKEIKNNLLRISKLKAENGYEAEKSRVINKNIEESMSTIGG